MKLNSLENRVQILEDIEEIKQLHVHYVNCVITTKWDELAECFSKSGTFDAHAGTATGREAIKKFFAEKVSNNHIGKEGLFAVHPIITVDGDKAKGSWLLYIQFALPRKLKDKMAELPTDDAPDWLHGFHEMDYVKEDGKWKISYLKFRCRLWSPMSEVIGD
jgi:hypothetical protein